MKLVMMGTGTFAEPTLETLLKSGHPVVGAFTQPDREGVVKRGSTRQVGRGIKEIATEHRVPVFQPVKVNDPEGVAMLRGLAPDLLVVAAYGQILSKEVLSIPSIGAINVHGSLLPKYRGAAPVARAILQGESETGVTIIRMSVGLDAGEMLAKVAVPIGEETAGELEAKLAPLGADLALDVIRRMALGPVTGERQDPSLVTKAPKLSKDEGAIDFTHPAGQVARHIRGMQPWPTPYTHLHRTDKPPMRLLILRVGHPISTDHAPGSAIVTPDGQLCVACGDSQALPILELQPAGKKRQTAAEFLRGYPPTGSDRFDSSPV